MFRLRSLCLVVAALVSPAIAVGFPSSPAERAEIFASCAGNYAAEEEHQRLTSGNAYRSAKDRADMFSMLLEASLTPSLAEGDPAIGLRIVRGEALARQRLLLTAANYSIRPSQREPARFAAARRLTMCEALLLGD